MRLVFVCKVCAVLRLAAILHSASPFLPACLPVHTGVADTCLAVADPGTHSDAEGTGMRVVAFSTTMGGMCVFALMIGIISDFIGEKVDDLKKGKSRVIESGHTLMLGWSDMSLAIIQQIALANESENGGVIVVLAKNDKEDMETELNNAMDSQEEGLQLKGTEVIFRSGNTLAEHDLNKASVHTARSIIALSEGFDPDEADSRMVRQILSLRGMLSRSQQENPAHVVCELRDVDNKHLVEMVGKGLVETVCAHDVIGRLMIQCARAAGLAHVLENLMGFDGDEFYLKEWPELLGLRFGDIGVRFDDAVPIGIKHDDVVVLNPPDDQIIEDGDEILVLAEDDDSYEVNDGSRSIPVVGDLPDIPLQEKKPEVLLFCGWRRDIADMILVGDTMACLWCGVCAAGFGCSPSHALVCLRRSGSPFSARTWWWQAPDSRRGTLALVLVAACSLQPAPTPAVVSRLLIDARGLTTMRTNNRI